MEGRTYQHKNQRRCMERWMDGLTNTKTKEDVWRDGWMDLPTQRPKKMYGEMEGRTYQHKDQRRCMERWMDGLTNTKTKEGSEGAEAGVGVAEADQQTGGATGHNGHVMHQQRVHPRQVRQRTRHHTT